MVPAICTPRSGRVSPECSHTTQTAAVLGIREATTPPRREALIHGRETSRGYHRPQARDDGLNFDTLQVSNPHERIANRPTLVVINCYYLTDLYYHFNIWLMASALKWRGITIIPRYSLFSQCRCMRQYNFRFLPGSFTSPHFVLLRRRGINTSDPRTRQRFTEHQTSLPSVLRSMMPGMLCLCERCSRYVF